MPRSAKSVAPSRTRHTTTRRKSAARPKPAAGWRPAKAAPARKPGAAPVRVVAKAPRHTRRREAFVFTATLADRGPTGLWPHLFLPREASAYLGRRGAVNVILGVDGARFRRTAKPDGKGGHFVLFNADMRERSGIEPGDRFEAALQVDAAPRVLDVPKDLTQSLRDDRAARAAFAGMPPSHRRAYVEFIEEAKRPETRVRRIQQALRMMAEWGAERAKAKP